MDGARVFRAAEDPVSANCEFGRQPRPGDGGERNCSGRLPGSYGVLLPLRMDSLMGRLCGKRPRRASVEAKRNASSSPAAAHYDVTMASTASEGAASDHTSQTQSENSCEDKQSCQTRSPNGKTMATAEADRSQTPSRHASSYKTKRKAQHQDIVSGTDSEVDATQERSTSACTYESDDVASATEGDSRYKDNHASEERLTESQTMPEVDPSEEPGTQLSYVSSYETDGETERKHVVSETEVEVGATQNMSTSNADASTPTDESDDVAPPATEAGSSCEGRLTDGESAGVIVETEADSSFEDDEVSEGSLTDDETMGELHPSEIFAAYSDASNSETDEVTQHQSSVSETDPEIDGARNRSASYAEEAPVTDDSADATSAAEADPGWEDNQTSEDRLSGGETMGEVDPSQKPGTCSHACSSEANGKAQHKSIASENVEIGRMQSRRTSNEEVATSTDESAEVTLASTVAVAASIDVTLSTETYPADEYFTLCEEIALSQNLYTSFEPNVVAHVIANTDSPPVTAGDIYLWLPHFCRMDIPSIRYRMSLYTSYFAITRNDGNPNHTYTLLPKARRNYTAYRSVTKDRVMFRMFYGHHVPLAMQLALLQIQAIEPDMDFEMWYLGAEIARLIQNSGGSCMTVREIDATLLATLPACRFAVERSSQALPIQRTAQLLPWLGFDRNDDGKITAVFLQEAQQTKRLLLESYKHNWEIRLRRGILRVPCNLGLLSRGQLASLFAAIP